MAESEIPSDIRRTALGVFWKLAERAEETKKAGEAFWSAERTADIIAEALLSERRQCANIAYNAALYSGCPADFIAEEIAETVRNGRRQP